MSNAIEQQKNRLRKTMRDFTCRLPADYMDYSDQGILKTLLSLTEWKQAHTVFLYISIGREAGTRSAIQAAINTGKVVAVPRCLCEGIMEARIISSMEGLRPGRFGAPEPDAADPLLLPRDMDLVIAPCIAADRQGHRLGHGGGFYDRYLAQTQCPSICLCRERLLLRHVPHNTLDCQVAMVITEEGCIRI